MSSSDRETEAQAKKGDENPPTNRQRARSTFKKYWGVGLRSVELMLAIIATGLVVGALTAPQVVQSDHRHIALIYSAYSSYIIIAAVLVIAWPFGERLAWRTSVGFSAVGCIMFTAAAAVIFFDWQRSYYANLRPNKVSYDLLIASGVFAIINAAIFCGHACQTYKDKVEY